MYTIYADGQLLHTPHLFEEGCGVFSPKVTVEMNKAGSLEFTMPPGHVLYDEIKKLKSVLVVYQNGEEIFRGRVLNDEKDFWKQKKTYCEGELAFLLDSIQRPYSYSGTVSGLFTQLINNHNARVDEYKQFTVGNITLTGSVGFNSDDYPNTFDEIQKRIIDEVGGYIQTRESGGKRYIDLLAASTDQGSVSTTGQLIEFGRNLLDITEHISAEDISTVLIPVGGQIKTTDSEGNETISDEKWTISSVNDGKDYVENTTAIGLFGRIEQKVDWSDVEDPTELKNLATELLKYTIEQAVSLTVKAVDLHILDVAFEKIKVGDWVRVISLPHELDANFQCRKIVYDLESPDKNEYSFGVDMSTLTDQQVAMANKPAASVVLSGGDFVKSSVFGDYQVTVDGDLADLRSDVDELLQLMNSGLPVGFVLLNYIESTGTQYIDTGFKPNQNSKVEIDYETSATSGGIAWTDDAWVVNGFGISADGYTYGTAHYLPGTIGAERHTESLDKGQAYRNGTLIYTMTSDAFQSTYPLFLFTANRGGVVQSITPSKIYSCKIYDNGTLVRDFVPCKNPSGIAGLYDKANGQFYANAGSGTFTTG